MVDWPYVQVYENVEHCQRSDHDKSVRYDRNGISQESTILARDPLGSSLGSRSSHSNIEPKGMIQSEIKEKILLS